jgi:hypothetical protein
MPHSRGGRDGVNLIIYILANATLLAVLCDVGKPHVTLCPGNVSHVSRHVSQTCAERADQGGDGPSYPPHPLVTGPPFYRLTAAASDPYFLNRQRMLRIKLNVSDPLCASTLRNRLCSAGLLRGGGGQNPQKSKNTFHQKQPMIWSEKSRSESRSERWFEALPPAGGQ